MRGIDLDEPIAYKHASFRYFEENEYHITRLCRDNVLLLVFDGVLRFTEEGKPQEVRAGEYYVQRKNCEQTGGSPSDAPRYLYVHFDGEWSEGEHVLPYRGSFSYSEARELMSSVDAAAHEGRSYCERQYLLLKLLLLLLPKPKERGLAHRIAAYMENDPSQVASLEDLCAAFHYSKNYILRVFKKEFGVSPFVYLNALRLRRACTLLETTSSAVEEVAEACGYRSYSYFYRVFIREYGLAPTAWRRRVRENPVSV